MANIYLNLGQYEDTVEATSYRVEYWYNRHDRYWVVTVLDNFDREVESRTPYNKAQRDTELADLAEKYNTADMKKL